ncbi:hypothetical protein Vretifemale_11576 [Volvox reticuliferus]|uniref:Uncharacterized protein n=1 Tax=Volvox reticuliferus TaxID=1737510 RepID=A0A8J4FQ32_9CHLO|nr:hypothetical protein Vretifemale_11576 [Volvox reticuliferus]
MSDSRYISSTPSHLLCMSSCACAGTPISPSPNHTCSPAPLGTLLSHSPLYCCRIFNQRMVPKPFFLSFSHMPSYTSPLSYFITPEPFFVSLTQLPGEEFPGTTEADTHT